MCEALPPNCFFWEFDGLAYGLAKDGWWLSVCWFLEVESFPFVVGGLERKKLKNF